jgi:hypothetical protein
MDEIDDIEGMEDRAEEARTFANKPPHWVKKNKLSIIVVASSIITIVGALVCLGQVGKWVDTHITRPYISAVAQSVVNSCVESRLTALQSYDSTTRARVSLLYYNQISTMTPAQIAKAKELKRRDSILTAMSH